MDVAITSLGTAVPMHRGVQTDVVEFMCKVLSLNATAKKRLKALYRLTGIDFRHSVLEDYTSTENLSFFPENANAAFPSTSARMQIYKAQALPLALTAIADCIGSLADFDKQTLTHLITISCTGMYAPGLDIDIVQALELPKQIKRTAIQFMGCYAAINGLKMANDICRANPTAKVLVVSVELCTLHLQKNTTVDHLISGSIFADGAAAAVIEANPDSDRCLKLHNFYCDILPQSSQEMAWHIGDNGFEMVLTSYVPQIIKSGIAHFVQRCLAQHAIELNDIDVYAIHPGGKAILQACEQALGIPSAANCYSYQVLRDYGNMSSATILFVLKAIWQDLTALDDKKTIFSCAFGPGLTLESMVLESCVSGN